MVVEEQLGPFQLKLPYVHFATDWLYKIMTL